ncbi:urease accessory protein UreF [Glutamicibacter halophytocola]|uniref:Urease accessory protein UreF n=1 Tax=Glutamicibacter halophytocola TaxID=1933880 RepID=A0ABX5Y8Z5_9MICC|nr:urease accessory protein UreF [Glutamicibacter halophytocola]NQD42468.1 urease accessory protein UreF [Glutamicibacter halophytocola]QDY65419.1 urease accessory protein UreF [Glutamicibacter halophytocola]
MQNTPTSSGHLLTLLQLSDSALPTGAFSHSFGMESYLETGQVHDEASFAHWLRLFLEQSLTYTDGLLLRLAFEADNDQRIIELDRLIHASALPRQLRIAAQKMGARMLAVALAGFPVPSLRSYQQAVQAGTGTGHPAIAYALAARGAGAPLADALSSYLFSTATSLTQNAIRAIPLGQDAGQRVIRQMHETVNAAVAKIFTLDDQDLGVATPGLEIAQMRHEHQRARMFMS